MSDYSAQIHEEVMGQFLTSYYPVFIEFHTDDTPIDEYVDEWGTIDIFNITAINFENMTPSRWRIKLIDINNREMAMIINPFQANLINILEALRPINIIGRFSFTKE